LSQPPRLRVIFAGTPEFARVALERLHAAGHEIALVLTQPDRPGGRGMKLQTSAVKQFALDHNIPLAQPRSLRLDGKYPDDAQQARDAIHAANADVMVVAAYGLILPQWVLNIPRLGCLNIHGSLLPRWRGAAPIHRAIEAGDLETGITIMQMDAGLDTGDMLLVEKLLIADTETTGQLHDRLAALGGRLIVEALALAADGGLQRVKQPEIGATYAHKIEKHEAAIDWNQTADSIVRRIRAFDPFPGAHAVLAGETLKVWAATARAIAAADTGGTNAAAECGSILTFSHGVIEVLAMNSVVMITQLQRPGGKRLSAANFSHGFEIKPGMRFAHNAAHPI
jgi:methionyl-tRNA formyltransferase